MEKGSFGSGDSTAGFGSEEGRHQEFQRGKLKAKTKDEKVLDNEKRQPQLFLVSFCIGVTIVYTYAPERESEKERGRWMTVGGIYSTLISIN